MVPCAPSGGNRDKTFDSDLPLKYSPLDSRAGGLPAPSRYCFDFERLMHTRKPNPRVEYRLLESQRSMDSASLAQKFPKLKSLKVDLDYFDSKGITRNGGMKYKANLDHAKSVFRFNCVSGDCVGGDYDLSDELSRAIAAKRKVVTGELRCEGVRHNKERKDQAPCHNILRYKLSLGY